MHFPHSLFPESWLWTAGLCFLLTLIIIAARAPWHRLSNNEQQHVYFGTCVLLLLLWTIRVNAFPGLSYHYLGATLVTLMFGWHLAIMAICLVLAASVVTGSGDWQAYPLDALVMGIIPISLSYGIYRLVEETLPRNFFIYLFLCAFFSAAITILGTMILSMTLLSMTDAVFTQYLWQHLFPTTLLLAFPEAFITGTIILTLVMMRPHWVQTYHDDTKPFDR